MKGFRDVNTWVQPLSSSAHFRGSIFGEQGVAQYRDTDR